MATTEPPPASTEDESAFVHDDMIDARRGGDSRQHQPLRPADGHRRPVHALRRAAVILGIFDSQAEIDKAAGVRINLWTGLGMLVIGVSFLLWCGCGRCTTEEIAEAVEAAHEKDEEPAT